MYRISVTASVQKKLSKLPAGVREKISTQIDALATALRPSGCKKINRPTGYRVRIGDYRMTYLIEDGKLMVPVIDVGDRKNIYDG